MNVVDLKKLRRAYVGQETVSGDGLRRDRLIAEEPGQVPGCSPHVPVRRDRHVEHFAFVLDGPPEVHPLAPYGADHLVQMPAG